MPKSMMFCMLLVTMVTSERAHMPRIRMAARLSSGLVLGITPVKYSNRT